MADLVDPDQLNPTSGLAYVTQQAPSGLAPGLRAPRCSRGQWAAHLSGAQARCPLEMVDWN